MEISSFATAGGANSAHLFGTKGTLKVDFDTQNLALSTGGGAYAPVDIRPDERLEWNVEAEFIGAIRGQNEVRLTDFATAVRYMEFTDAVAESAKTGQRIDALRAARLEPRERVRRRGELAAGVGAARSGVPRRGAFPGAAASNGTAGRPQTP